MHAQVHASDDAIAADRRIDPMKVEDSERFNVNVTARSKRFSHVHFLKFARAQNQWI